VLKVLDVSDMNDILAIVNGNPVAKKYDEFTKIYSLRYLLGFDTCAPLKYDLELGIIINESAKSWLVKIQEELKWMF
jgi:hypothetical protein